MEYIANVAKFQIASGTIKSKPSKTDDEPKAATGVSGVIVVKSGHMKGKVRCITGKGHNKRSKYFSNKRVVDADAVDDAIDRAKAFKQQKSKPSSCVLID